MKIAIIQPSIKLKNRSSACKGLLKHISGSEITIIEHTSNLRKYDMLCFIGYETFSLANKNNEKLPPYLILDVAYFGSVKKTWFHLAWGGINGLGRYYQTYFDNSRTEYIGLRKLKNNLKVNRTNEYVLILAQNPTDSFLIGRGINYQKWINKVCTNLRNTSQKPIYIRPSPNGGEIHIPKFVTILQNTDSLLEQVKRASATVAFSSSSGMYSLFMGVPHISCDPGSIIYDITTHSCDEIDNLPDPDLQQVKAKLEQLTWQCWTLKEIATGKPIDILINGLGPEGVKQ